MAPLAIICRRLDPCAMVREERLVARHERSDMRDGWSRISLRSCGLQICRVWGSHKMIWIANLLVALVAALHVYFMVLEMFLWTKPLGLKTFRHSPEKAEDSAVLAANQGLYNGFLAAGLIWGLVQGVPSFAFQIKMFFLLCVIVAGV